MGKWMDGGGEGGRRWGETNSQEQAVEGIQASANQNLNGETFSAGNQRFCVFLKTSKQVWI